MQLLRAEAAPDRWMLRPEKTGWTETSRNQEVMEILDLAASIHPRIHLTHFGYSTEGSPLPLLVVGPVAPPTPKQIRESGTLRIYLQANIHAGEVAGKEALLRLVRDLARGEREDWTRDWVLLIAPNYNPDGNDRIHLRNRLRQHGPTGGMGTRENAQGLDLNRDQMKLESPEARSLARLLTEWDPHLILDLHTTNGTHHGYHLTYAPPLHPATPQSIDRWLRHELLPAVDEAMDRQWGWKTFHYGNRFQRGEVDGWWSFDCRPRFVTNYAGVRQRAAILVEAYAYLTFQDRVLATERFLHALLSQLAAKREAVKNLVERAIITDFRGRRIPFHGEMATHPPEQAQLLGEVSEEAHPHYAEPPLFRRGSTVNAVSLPTATRFEPVHWLTLPEAYFLPPEGMFLKDQLEAHGIAVLPAPADFFPLAERFHIRESVPGRSFQGRELLSLRGEWRHDQNPRNLEGLVVPLDQPLGLLAALLLEPESEDGFVHWGFLTDAVEAGGEYPIWRIVLPAEPGSRGK